MENIRIATRLMLQNAVLTMLLVVVGLIGLYGLNATNQTLESVNEDRVVPLVQLEEASRLLQRNRILVMDMMINADPANWRKRETEFQANRSRLDSLWKAFMATTLTEEEARLAKELSEKRSAYISESLLPTIAALKSGDPEGARRLYETKVSPMSAATLEVLTRLVKLQESEAEKGGKEAQARFATIRVLAIGAMVLGLGFALVFGSILIRGITSALQQAVAVSEAVASGDLSQQIVPVGQNELGQVLEALARMQQALRELVGGVRRNAEQVAATTGEIARGNMDLSGRTESQASALEETAASMEELSSTVNQNADNARQANQLAQSASTVAVDGGQIVGQVVDTMRGISDSSKKIADIINVIDGIAFQTNILALNAAVEAARAGEQGRGFAVVASEVRSLASRSAEAAKQIKELITDSVQRVEAGTALVDRAGHTMGDVVSSIQRVTDIMAEIAEASKEQSAGVHQVSEAVTQMDETTQQNAALVEEMAAAATALQDQAQAMVQAVSVFRTGSEARAGALAVRA
ncbi:methyl-accepting chemotaxis protein [Massilia sp. TS11]|uniref:methyl-accepting chemotaxis protein n=1 Tax=Massilia sp. TS11 TaxID=2908003 RepID=UPI0027D9B722|nr:methyl-accepting chemotaxis protein [Massilia sp. TS11]